jgi:uroporphyrinogen-III decarboxylase
MDTAAVAATPVDAAETYDRRLQRIEDAVALRVPDRVPLRLMFGFWAARQAGMTCQEAMYDAKRFSAATKAAILKYRPDEAMGAHGLTSIGSVLEMVEFGGLMWPGRGLPPDVPYQYLDKEYMTAEEYDEYLFDPTGFILHKYIPRLAGAASGFAALPDLTGVIHFQFLGLPAALARPEVARSIETLTAAGRKLHETIAEAGAFAQEMQQLGFPGMRGGFSTAPYDRVSDFLRGSKGAMLDMFRRKDKLLEMLDKLTVSIIKCAIAETKASGGRYAMMPIHWGLDGFMSPKQFNTFFWPQLRRVLMALIEADIVPLLLWEGTCDSRLETIADVPRGKCIYWFERTDMFRAKQVLGDIVCLQGNVPMSLLCAGTPEDVDAYCRKLIEVVGKDGGFILCPATGVPESARPENVAAMSTAVRKYNPYK